MARQIQTIPGVGPLTAMAIDSFAPLHGPLQKWPRLISLAWACTAPIFFRWQRTLGTRLKGWTGRYPTAAIMGAMSRLNWLGRKSIPKGSWLDRMMARKPKILVAIALANKMARTIWAMLTKGTDYQI